MPLILIKLLSTEDSNCSLFNNMLRLIYSVWQNICHLLINFNHVLIEKYILYMCVLNYPWFSPLWGIMTADSAIDHYFLRMERYVCIILYLFLSIWTTWETSTLYWKSIPKIDNKERWNYCCLSKKTTVKHFVFI